MTRKIKLGLVWLFVSAHVLIGGYSIVRWFIELPVKVSIAARHMPRDERIFTLGINEYRLIQMIRANLPEDAHFVWMQQVSGVVNYYIYPRRIYWHNPLFPGDPVEFDRDFMLRRGVGFMFIDYDKIYPVQL